MAVTGQLPSAPLLFLATFVQAVPPSHLCFPGQLHPLRPQGGHFLQEDPKPVGPCLPSAHRMRSHGHGAAAFLLPNPVPGQEPGLDALCVPREWPSLTEKTREALPRGRIHKCRRRAACTGWVGALRSEVAPLGGPGWVRGRCLPGWR